MLPSLPILCKEGPNVSVNSPYFQFTLVNLLSMSAFPALIMQIISLCFFFYFIFFCVLNIWKQIYKLVKVGHIWSMLVLSWGLLAFPTVSRGKWEMDYGGQTQTMVMGFHGSQKELRLYFCTFSNKLSHMYSHENVAFKVLVCVFIWRYAETETKEGHYVSLGGYHNICGVSLWNNIDRPQFSLHDR